MRKVCANCGHHRSMHVYHEDALRECRLCDCPGWRQPEKYERIKSRVVDPKLMQTLKTLLED